MQQNRHARILIVEDDMLVRELLVDILREAGFEAQEADCAREALRELAARPFDLVMSDIDMPGELDGIDLARHIGGSWPETRVILISGRSRPALPGDILFLPKPFTAARLIAAVTQMITQPICLAS
ncbi:MAG TPA: response regulator [Methylovirgula sp.]|nr:response regulator [Methylovirgula sp.]